MAADLVAGVGSYTLQQIADYLGAELRGDPGTEIRGLATLEGATGSDLSFLANPAYRKHLSDTQAGAVIVAPQVAGDCPVNVLVLDNPYLGFARVTRLFDDRPWPDAGVHATAVIADSARVDPSASVGPNCVVGADAVVGARTVLGAGTVIGERSGVGEDCYFHPRVTIAHAVRIGSRVIIHSGAVIGSDGFGFAPDGGKWEKIAQIGSVVVGDDVEIGANTTVDRGALDDTIIEDGVILDNQIQIAHNVRIGAYTAVAGNTAIAGTARIGRNCTIGGQSGIAGHLEIADNVHVGGMSMVIGDIREPGAYASGTGSLPMAQWKKCVVRFRQLEDIARRLKALEKKAGE